MASIAALCKAGDLKTAYNQAWENFQAHSFSQLAQHDLHQVVCACLEKAGRDAAPAAAVRWLHKLASLNLPPHGQRDERLGWAMRGVLAAFGQANVPVAALGQVLAAMLPLPLADAPSKGRSVLLQAALKHREALTADWLCWWNLAALRPEDWHLETYADGRRAAITLAEQAHGALTRCLLATASPDEEKINDFLPQLDRAIERLPAAQWLPYYKAKLQLHLHADRTVVLPVLLPIVRQKSSEFWAWQLLAEALEATDPAAALACLYRASACGSDEKFLGKLRLKLARLLADTHPSEARWQFNQAQATYAAEGRSLKGEALLLGIQLAAHPAASAETARREWLALAEQTTYGDLPWQPVVMQFISPETPEKPALARLLPAGEAPRPLGVPLKKYRWLQGLPLGTPLQVKCELVAGRPKVILLQKRPTGTLWDVVPAQVAVVTGISPDGTRAFFTAAPGQYGALQLAGTVLSNILPGDSVQVRLQAREKDGAVRYHALIAELTTATAPDTICRFFKGPLRLHQKGFGFADNIFLPPHLITRQGLFEGAEISGQAVLTHSRAKGKDEWSVLRINLS